MIQLSPMSRPARPRPRTVAALALTAVALAGCTSDPAPEVVRTSSPDTRTPSGTASPTSTAPAEPSPGSTAPGTSGAASTAPASAAPGGQAAGGLGKPVTVSGVTVSLTDVRSTSAGGASAVSVTVVVRNGRSQGVSLGGAQVRLEHAGVRAKQDASSTPVPSAVGAGKTVKGTYVYALADDARDEVTVTVSSKASGPLTFTGPAPAA